MNYTLGGIDLSGNCRVKNLFETSATVNTERHTITGRKIVTQKRTLKQRNPILYVGKLLNHATMQQFDALKNDGSPIVLQLQSGEQITVIINSIEPNPHYGYAEPELDVYEPTFNLIEI